MKKRVLVCGASGFIGRNIFEALSKNSNLDVSGTYFKKKFSDNPRLLEVDLRKSKNVNEVTRGMDIVIHAAAVTDGLGAIRANPAEYVADNIIMNTLIAKAVLLNEIPHLMFMSCSVVYADSPLPQTEEEANLDYVHPQYFMGARIKTSMEDLCNFYSQHCNSRFTMIRHSNIYGPYDKFNLEKGHVFAATIKKIVSAKDSDKIVVWGEGKEKRDFLFISDLVDFIETAVITELPLKFNILNVGSGVGISVADLVSRVVNISGKNIELVYDSSKPKLGNKIVLNCRKVRSLTGWRPKIDLNEGIRQTIDWYLKNARVQSER